ncbi:MAG: peptidoglycan DD-metalloendopeptidase family protein, partial [Bacteroidota bacterium]
RRKRPKTVTIANETVEIDPDFDAEYDDDFADESTSNLEFEQPVARHDSPTPADDFHETAPDPDELSEALADSESDHANIHSAAEAESAPRSQDRPAVQPRRPRRPSRVLSIVFAFITLAVLAAFILIPTDRSKVPGAAAVPQEPNCLGIHPAIDWGYALHELECQGGVTQEGQGLGEILLNYKVDYKRVIQLNEIIRKKKYPGIRAGNTFQLLYPQGNPLQPNLLAYSPTPTTFVLLNLKGEAAVHYHERVLLSREKSVSDVVIQSSLAEAMYNREFGLMLTREMEGALKWKIDLFHLDPGDRFRLLFDKMTYEGDLYDVGELSAVEYRHKGEQKTAIWFSDEYASGFYDMDGRPMRTGFLKAPLKYGRISSPYNPQRLDPLKSGKIIPHLGTDYAAPMGTPIIAVADGVVMKAEFKGGNGNYVKLLHTKEVQTQYLHMSKFAT